MASKYESTMSDVDKLKQDIRTQRVIQYLDDRNNLYPTVFLPFLPGGNRLWSLSDEAIVKRIVKIKDNEIKQACIDCLQVDYDFDPDELDSIWNKPLEWVLLYTYEHILKQELEQMECTETDLDEWDVDELEELLDSCIQAKEEIKRNKKWWQLW